MKWRFVREERVDGMGGKGPSTRLAVREFQMLARPLCVVVSPVAGIDDCEQFAIRHNSVIVVDFSR